jgi:glutamate carboxypeptidase
MPDTSRSSLDWIDQQRDRMVELVTTWASINTSTLNLTGLNRLSVEFQREFSALGGEMTQVALRPLRSINNSGDPVETPLAPAISVRKRPNAPLRVLLGIHMDTVFGAEHPFQRVERVDSNTLRGPGVVDAKGGLCVMLVALQAFERSDLAKKIGWEVLINTDEEIGSPGSAPVLAECAGRNDFGLVYEPAFADGALVSERKGSGNFTAVIRGRAAHAGRDFHHGRNAIHAAAAMVLELDEINRRLPGVTVNVGRIDGGGPVNIVPDLAIVRFNIRVPTVELQQRAEAEIKRIAESIDQREGISVQLEGGVTSPPKLLDEPTRKLLGVIESAATELGWTLATRPSGGVSDGNKLAAAGLPVIDTLGPRGGNLHSDEEFLMIDSLTERAKLSALVLMKLARGELGPME